MLAPSRRPLGVRARAEKWFWQQVKWYGVYCADLAELSPCSLPRFLTFAVPSLAMFFYVAGVATLIRPVFGAGTANGTLLTAVASVILALMLVSYARAWLSDPGRVPVEWAEWDGREASMPAVPEYARVAEGWTERVKERVQEAADSSKGVTEVDSSRIERPREGATLTRADIASRVRQGGFMMMMDSAEADALFADGGIKWQPMGDGAACERHGGCDKEQCNQNGPQARPVRAAAAAAAAAVVAAPVAAAAAGVSAVMPSKQKRQQQQQPSTINFADIPRIAGMNVRMQDLVLPPGVRIEGLPQTDAGMEAARERQPVVDLNLAEEGPKACQKCQAYKPPRAHHCSACKRCVMRMDHHCPWLNNCVGIGNWKFFFLFLVYVVSGLLMFEVLAVVRVYYLGAPGLRTLEGVLVYGGLCAALAFTRMVADLVLYHGRLAVRNATQLEDMFESGTVGAKYGRGDAYANLELVLGPQPLLWLLPV